MTTLEEAVVFLLLPLLLLLPLSTHLEAVRLVGIFERSAPGLRFLRGFPRGMWGTALAPELGPYDEDSGDAGMLAGLREKLMPILPSLDGLWVKAKGVFLEDIDGYDAQSNYDRFIERLPYYLTRGTTYQQASAHFFGPSEESLPVLYLMWWCTEHWPLFYDLMNKGHRNASILRSKLMEYCPSPCYGAPCKRIIGVGIPSSCEVIGPFEAESTGNKNCGVEFGNRCNPILGTDFYTCSCAAGWISSPYLPYENCALANDPCTGYIGDQDDTGEKPQLTVGKECLNGGTCISSPDLTKAEVSDDDDDDDEEEEEEEEEEVVVVEEEEML
ncbi:hypothetical protein SprV_0401616100 [Sparganum proliferum]